MAGKASRGKSEKSSAVKAGTSSVVNDLKEKEKAQQGK